MAFKVEDIEDESRFRKILTLSYGDLLPFIFEYLKRRSAIIIFFWAICIAFLLTALKIRYNISGYYPVSRIMLHSLLGIVILPLICIPVHELLHVIPYFLSGARNIRAGMDLKQYLFYVTVHRHVATPAVFRMVALTPFIVISLLSIYLIYMLPGLWKWSLSLFLFAHATMCAGDFALLNFYISRGGKKVYTWDDADKKEAYFYEMIE